MLQVYSDCVLKVVSVTKNMYIGFDVLTEAAVEKPKTAKFIQLGDSLLNLVKSEVCRTRLVYNINPDLETGMKLLGVQKTAYIRMRSAILVPKKEKINKKQAKQKTRSKIVNRAKN